MIQVSFCYVRTLLQGNVVAILTLLFFLAECQVLGEHVGEWGTLELSK